MRGSFNSIPDVHRFIDNIPMFGKAGTKAANFSLDRILAFCNEMGNPQDQFPSIHVAGTNGKGTTCRMLASVYQQAGYKTGLYTSPHLLDFSERVKINSEVIIPEALIQFFNQYAEKSREYELTYFELTTALAFWYFYEQKVDIAILETGLGGRLDATNIIDPLVSVITSIGLDHTDILGDTIEEIAFEKSGIIKPHKPVVIGKLSEPAKQVIESISKSSESVLFEANSLKPESVDGQIILRNEGSEIHIPFPGRKKIDAINAAMAYWVVECLQETYPVAEGDFLNGISCLNERYPNQVHFGKLAESRNWYFDGAHNYEATEALIDELLSRAAPDQWTVILSYMSDKLQKEIGELWKPFPQIKLYQQNGERAATIEQMKRYFPHAEAVSDSEFTRMLNSEEYKSELVIFSGSFYFYEKVRRWMGTTTALQD